MIRVSEVTLSGKPEFLVATIKGNTGFNKITCFGFKPTGDSKTVRIAGRGWGGWGWVRRCVHLVHYLDLC